MIPAPYLLYIGGCRDFIGIKTSRGVAAFRPQDCVGEYADVDNPLTLGLARLDFAEAVARGARTLVLGVANPGGRLDQRLVADAHDALEAGLHVAAGLHQRLGDEPRLAAAAAARGLHLFDVREPPRALAVGTGQRRAGRRLLTVGTDCSVGKMYSSLALVEAMRAAGIRADFRATGQTGILIAGQGVPVDAVVADFISGAIEALSPARQDEGWDVIEGQGSLFHPSFAGVSTGLLHGAQPDALLLCHQPGRAHMRGLPHYRLPGLAECLEMNLAVARLTNPAVRAIGIALNTHGMAPEDARAACAAAGAELGLPATDPVTMGCGPIVEELVRCFGR